MTQKEIDHLLNWLEQNKLQRPIKIVWWVELKAWAISQGYCPQQVTEED